MATKSIITDPKWVRFGPGRGTEFDASDEQIEGILRERLLDEFQPYRLVTFQSERQGRHHKWTAHEHDIGAFQKLACRGEWDYFVRSLSINPVVRWNQIESPQSVCSIRHGK